MSIPISINDRIALAKGWVWRDAARCYVSPNGSLYTDCLPDFVGTLKGVDGMMRELNETRAKDVKYYNWSLRWSALFQIWDFYGEDEITEERRVQFQSTKEEGSGIAVGKAYVSVFEREPTDAD